MHYSNFFLKQRTENNFIIIRKLLYMLCMCNIRFYILSMDAFLFLFFLKSTSLNIILFYLSYTLSIMKESHILHVSSPTKALIIYWSRLNIYTPFRRNWWIDLHIDFHYKYVYYNSRIEHFMCISCPLKFIYLYTIEIFFSFGLSTMYFMAA